MGLSTRKAVSSAKLSPTKAKKVAGDQPHAGVILVNESKNAGTKAKPKSGRLAPIYARSTACTTMATAAATLLPELATWRRSSACGKVDSKFLYHQCEHAGV